MFVGRIRDGLFLPCAGGLDGARLNLLFRSLLRCELKSATKRTADACLQVEEEEGRRDLSRRSRRLASWRAETWREP